MDPTTLAILVVLLAKTDNRNINVEYQFQFSTMKACLYSAVNIKITKPAPENETTIAMVCIPEQEIKHQGDK